LKELELEDNFGKLIASQLHINYYDYKIEILDTIIWWKLKNKWKRAVTVDDTKALRMILQKLKKNIIGVNGG